MGPVFLERVWIKKGLFREAKGGGGPGLTPPWGREGG